MSTETIAAPRIGSSPRLRHGVGTVARRFAMVALAALVLASLHLRHRPATLCLFREVTGLPCPFCGGTTAAVRLGHGQVGSALAASPLAVAMLATWPFLGVVRAPGWWQIRWLRWSLTSGVLVGSEIWQLVRFGILHL
ncbi:MAG TPA: DUF2752 domain-containing protein [Mycobacteriales bacterium]|jgi:hypothetical protein|nr:DUF2752 domain-containing protein [Mycobacteriales bacterium]